MGLLTGCTVIDEKVSVVSNFDVNKYLGTWYEIARLDHSFERNMNKVTANYQLDKPSGKISVINKGFDTQSNQWDQAEGKAYFIEESNKGLLKVSFFGPFYGAYQIHDLIIQPDGHYSDALVIGPDNTYAWILSRNKHIDAATQQRFISKMETLGISADSIIWVEQ
ncbi:lipocalin family protein [Shewanella gaetbuli]